MITDTFTETFTVVGMTCGHCVKSVTGEIAQIPGVLEVDTDLGTGVVTVSSRLPVDRDKVAAAVDEAGYELTK